MSLDTQSSTSSLPSGQLGLWPLPSLLPTGHSGLRPPQSSLVGFALAAETKEKEPPLALPSLAAETQNAEPAIGRLDFGFFFRVQHQATGQSRTAQDTSICENNKTKGPKAAPCSAQPGSVARKHRPLAHLGALHLKLEFTFLSHIGHWPFSVLCTNTRPLPFRWALGHWPSNRKQQKQQKPQKPQKQQATVISQ